jgi:hypothetical protein
VVTHWRGPILCYTFGQKRTGLLDISWGGFGVQDGDCVLFSFGEIDCRCHVHKFVTAEKGYQEVIDELVRNYFVAIKENVDKFRMVRTFVLSITAPVDKDDPTIKNCPNYPFLGSNADRIRYVAHFNRRIRETCEAYGYTYFNAHDRYVGEDGLLRKELSDGYVHMRDTAGLVALLEEHDCPFDRAAQK